jgi:hypothetical protein
VSYETCIKRRNKCFIAACCGVAFVYADLLLADALVVNRAMFADTIAEYYVEDDLVRLELEIGQKDIAAFRNLLPDDLYRRLGYGETSLAERLARFTSRDVAILHDGKPLQGKITMLGPAARPQRDEITGEPLPTPEDQAEVVIRATIEYRFVERPQSLTLIAPRETGQANIGFVLYHKGVAVNDFRFLASGFAVQLDWQDAWYSRFSERGLRRRYFSPMTGFIYVEPYEVRKEIILRPSDVQRYVDLGLDGASTIPADRHDEIKARVVEFLSHHFPVTIDGEPVDGTIDRVNFLRRTLRSSVVVDNQDLDLLSAAMGVIYYFPTEGLPQTVEMTWDLFDERMQLVPAASVDQAGPLPVMLEPDFNILRWENFLRSPELPTLIDIEAPPGTLQRAAEWLRWVALALSTFLLVMLIRVFFRDRRVATRLVAASIICVSVSLAAFYQHQQSDIDEERLKRLAGDLLHNVYRAFDFRGDEFVYDVLEKSVSGELLTDIYLETQRGLELRNQGGARVKVKSTTVNNAALLDRDGNRLKVASDWNVSGSVGHWGHVHQRTNGYRAELEISEVDGAWKLTGLEILEEKRL